MENYSFECCHQFHRYFFRIRVLFCQARIEAQKCHSRIYRLYTLIVTKNRKCMQSRNFNIFRQSLLYRFKYEKKSRVVETVRSSMNNKFHKLMATGKVHCSPGRSVRSFENRTILSLELEMERMRSFCISNQVLIASVLYLTVRMYVRIIL